MSKFYEVEVTIVRKVKLEVPSMRATVEEDPHFDKLLEESLARGWYDVISQEYDVDAITPIPAEEVHAA